MRAVLFSTALVAALALPAFAATTAPVTTPAPTTKPAMVMSKPAAKPVAAKHHTHKTSKHIVKTSAHKSAKHTTTKTPAPKSAGN